MRKKHFQIYIEDIFQLFMQDEMVTEFVMEQLMTDLKPWSGAENLTYDPGSRMVYTIADYKNK